MRLDLLLFELRLFKSRSQAAAAIQEGAVMLDGAPAKPSRETGVGARITLPGGRVVEVLGLPRRGMSREAARDLVRDAGA